MELPKRKRIRLKDYNYSQNGNYFITICTNDRRHIFGEIVDEKMELNEYGEILYDEILNTMEKRQNVYFDNFIIMPNHIHILISLLNQTDVILNQTDVILNQTDTARRVPTMEQFGKPTKNSIPTIIRSLKSAVTKKIREHVGTRRAVSDPNHTVSDPNRAVSEQKIWQDRYYDHVIRDEDDYQRIWQYIEENPSRWIKDKFYEEN